MNILKEVFEEEKDISKWKNMEELLQHENEILKLKMDQVFGNPQLL